MLKVSIWYLYVPILVGIERYRYHHHDNTIVMVIVSVTTLVHMSVRLKILWFAKKIIPHFPSISKFTLKINIMIFFYVPISEVAPKFSHKFQEISIKIFQKFIFNVSKTFLTFL